MPPRNFTDEQEEVIAKDYLSGISERKLEKKYGVSRECIHGALKRQGVEFRTPAERNRLYELDNTVFDSIDNEHAAYWLGFLFADGNTNGRSLNVALKGSDYSHLVKLSSFLGSTRPVRQFIEGKYAKTSIQVTDQHLFDRLREIGITPFKEHPFLAINSIAKGLEHHFIRGVWDGDGFAAKNPQNGIGFCGQKNLMLWIQETIAAATNDTSTRKITKHQISYIYYLRYSGRRVSMPVYDYMFQDATVWLERKRKVVENWPVPQTRVRDAMGRYT